MNNTFNWTITPKCLAPERHLNESDRRLTHGFEEPNVLDNVKKVPWKNRKNIELEQLWKDHVAHLKESEIYVFEENVKHAIECNCCTKISVCNKNDEERERLHNTKSKIKRPYTNTLRIDRRILVPKVSVQNKNPLINNAKGEFFS